MNQALHISFEQLLSATDLTFGDRDMLAFRVDRPFEGISLPLRFDVLLFALVKEGSGKVGINLCEYKLQKNTLLVFHPRHYLNFIAEARDLVIDVVACSLNVVERVIPRLTDLTAVLVHRRSEPVELLSDEEADNLREYFRLLQEKMCLPASAFTRQKLLCILQAMLFEMLEVQVRKESLPSYHKTRKEEIMTKFILLVTEHFRTNRQVSYYAEQLCVSSKHLSAVVKEISGRTAGDWIENIVTIEAKVLLRSTDLPIQEIATALNFSNQSFFGKYFKHQTGFSPTEYRKREM